MNTIGSWNLHFTTRRVLLPSVSPLAAQMYSTHAGIVLLASASGLLPIHRCSIRGAKAGSESASALTKAACQDISLQPLTSSEVRGLKAGVLEISAVLR
jgi:hypothetical protein